MSPEDDEPGAERKAQRLLMWATVLAFVSIAVCGLDIMIKNQILAQAKESQGWLNDSMAGLDRLRRTLADGYPGPGGGPDEAGGAAGHAGDPGLAGMGGVRTGTLPDAGPDAGD
jgi:hypothetical protein